MPSAGINSILSKYEQLKKAWESKKLNDVGKLLLELKIEFATVEQVTERVRILA